MQATVKEKSSLWTLEKDVTLASQFCDSFFIIMISRLLKKMFNYPGEKVTGKFGIIHKWESKDHPSI